MSSYNKTLKAFALTTVIMIIGIVGALLLAWTTEMYTSLGQFVFLCPIAAVLIIILIHKPVWAPIAMTGLWATILTPFFQSNESHIILFIISFILGSITMIEVTKWLELPTRK